MIASLFSFGRKAKARTAPGERVYAIGDVHGCYDAMRELLDRIAAHHEARPGSSKLRLIFLGDIVDRGPDSARVIDFLRRVNERTPNLTVLMGNHEQLMLDSLAGMPNAQQRWAKHGGKETLASFGFDADRLQGDEAPRELASDMRDCVTQDVIDWLRARPLWTRSGDYLFCHAGVRPGVRLEEQDRSDLLWIRDEFLEWDGPFGGATVVHGHSIESEPMMGDWRIGIDTGAYRTGVLTAVCLDGEHREFLSTT